MPNTGNPSKGCQECKDRKVKCDQAPEACNRCIRNGRKCSGYPSPTDLTFRNSFVRRIDNNHDRTISSPMPTDWHQQAICMFLQDYIIDPDESKINFGHLQTLPKLLSETDQSSALSKAVSAVAFTNLAHRSSLSHISVAGRQSYGQALQSLSTRFRDHMDIYGDQTLATVLCLDLYEWISGERSSNLIWSNHVDVLETLLRVRNHHRRKSISKGLTYTAHGYLVEKNLSRNGEIDPEAMLSANEEQEPLVIQIRLLNFAICRMSKKANKILKVPSLDSESTELLSDMMQSGVSTDDKCQAWEDQANLQYHYQTYEMADLWPTHMHKAIKGTSKLHIYDTISIASMWNNYRTSRNYLLRLLIRIYSRLYSENPGLSIRNVSHDTIARMQSQSMTLAMDVCASVPYVFGEVDQHARLQYSRPNKAVGGLFLLWPLGSLLHLHFLPPEQVSWIKDRVAYIRDALGIYQAKAILNLANS